MDGKMPLCLSSSLRHRISLLRDHREHCTPFSYRNFQNSRPSLNELAAAHLYKAGVALDINELKYSTLLLKKIILITFHLFCLSEELYQDIKYSYVECQKICLIVHEFNQHQNEDQHEYFYRTSRQHIKQCSYERKKPSCLSTNIVYADMIEVYITTRAESITAALLRDCSMQNVLQLAKLERGFLVALTGLIATFTSILSTSSSSSIGRKKENVFVSNEMFTLQSSQSIDSTVIGWMDCLIPGAQSDVLKSVWKNAECKLWSNIAEILIAQSHPLFEGGRILLQFLPQLVKSAEPTDVQTYPVVSSCLRYVASVLLQEKYLAEWDEKFQHSLISCVAAYRKGFRRLKSHPHDDKKHLTSQLFLALDTFSSQKIEQLQVSMNDSRSILDHVELMKQSLPLSTALRAMAAHVTSTLLQSLSRNMFNWNLLTLSWLVGSEAPLIHQTIKRSVAMMLYVSSPRVSFPDYSSFHSLECMSRGVCIALHSIAMYVQETVEVFYQLFQQKWEQNCSRLLELHFPSPNYWKSLRNKRRCLNQPSDYCKVVVRNIFHPMMEATDLLSEEQQRNLLYLLLSVFYNVLRKSIMSYKALYKYPSVSQQLLVDYHYLHQWLMSSDRKLNEGVHQLLSKLPILTDFEIGLSHICGESLGKMDSATHSVAKLDISLPCNYFPVFTEIAWNSEQDWVKH